MGYKVPIDVLKGFKKALEKSNEVLENNLIDESGQYENEEIAKQIKANNKQIKILKDEFYID